MMDGRINREDFSSALARLREGAAEDPGRTSLVIDGVIQRFEFTFEQAWKLLQTMLRHQGFDCRSPRACVKQAFQAGIIIDGDGWIRMLEDRNRTSHLYDAKEALAIYRKIRGEYLPMLEALGKKSMEEAG